jgi:hypothetical protein
MSEEAKGHDNQEVKLGSDVSRSHSSKLLPSMSYDDPSPTPGVPKLSSLDYGDGVLSMLDESSVSPPSSPLRIKRGFREMTSRLTCGFLFEADPVWLWSIRPNSWATIFLTGPDELRLRQDHPVLFAKLGNKVVIITSTFAGDFPSIGPDFMWVSGTKPFIDQVSLPPVGRHVYLMLKSPRRCPSDLSHIQWTKLNHRHVGGVTNARATFGIDDRTAELRVDRDLTRCIGHVLKYSIRPRVCDPVPDVPHYVVSDVLSLAYPRRPVVYSTYMSRTGWGIRELTDEELASCFELPEYVTWYDRFLRDLIPLQLCRSVIDSVAESAHTDQPPQKARHADVSVEEDEHTTYIPSYQDVIWLPNIAKWLPGSWADADIADKAVKSDNAPVDFRPWHRRIQLVLPCTIESLSILERLAARKWRANISRCLFRFMEAVYGKGWFHRGFVLAKRKFADPWTSLSASKKRGRLGNSGVLMDGSSGGLITKEWSENDDVTGGREGEEGAENDDATGGREAETRDPNQLHLDLSRGLRVIGQILGSTWWEWSSGSSPLFWRWNGQEQIDSARDGMHIFVQSTLPRSRRVAKPPRFDSETRKLVSSKVEAMVAKSYLEVGVVRTTLHFFAVPKGDADIRVVFDGTSSGLNDCLWSPNFFLPTSRNAAEMLSFGSWMADMDFGEFFHNFFADDRVRKHSGVDVRPLAPFFPTSPSGGPVAGDLRFMGLRWSRLFMGMKPSPYNAVRFYYWGEEFGKGNLRNLANPFGYDMVVMNLPGMDTYDTTKPKLMKVNSLTGVIAGDVVTFVDDVRITGSSREHCHETHRQFASRMQYLGIQDAPRKFRPPSQDQAGAWTGTIFKITRKSITKSVSQEKWMKGQLIVKNLSEVIETHPRRRPLLNRKELERQTGFLNHLTMTFDEMTPFLKGFYLSLNSWRPKRDGDDWKMSDKSWLQCLMAQLDNGQITDQEFDNEVNAQAEVGCPDQVSGSTRLGDDVRALMKMFASEIPPEVNLRSKEIVTVIYGFGDASGTGLGATFTCGSGFTFRIGVWSSDESDQSSNWREFTNIVDSLEDEASAGNLMNSEVFMFTDNSTVEACAIKGSSSSPKLLGLVVRLRAMTTLYGIRIHIFHVSGTRMIAQGTDGVSRGFLGEGIMSGESMVSFIPIHMTATERSGGLVSWIKEWTGPSTIVLEPIDWFDVGHDIDGWKLSWDGFERPHLKEGRTYLWSPAPFAADLAIAELRRARIKRQSSSHVFVVPKLCAPLWIKQVYKAADIVFEVPSGQTFWEKSMHEPLLIAIVFPFIRSNPW